MRTRDMVVLWAVTIVMLTLAFFAIRRAFSRAEDERRRRDVEVAEKEARLAKIEGRVEGMRKLQADMVAQTLRHIREAHLPPEEGFHFEWPTGWQKVELVCPTYKYTKRCKTPAYFNEHPSMD